MRGLTWCAVGLPVRWRHSVACMKRRLWPGSRRSRNSTLMRRGDVVTVAASGDYGKPRPAGVVQTDAFPASHASVIICRTTSELVEAPDFRVAVKASIQNG